MAEGTVYLDVDDEITSAANRIRSSANPRVAIVVPYGSRIATSRMNFRLLSREATVNNRRLSVVAADPATRALAASAGLPVFATIAEYEAALAGPRPNDDAADGPMIAGFAGGAAAAAAAGATADTGTDAPAPVTPPATERPKRPSKATPKPTDPASEDTVAIAVPTAAAVAAGAARPVVDRPPVDRPAPDRPTRAATSDAGRIPVARGRPRIQVRTPMLWIAAATVLALLVVGVAGYLFLPAATIAVTPRQEAIGPIPLTVRADPAATEVDIEAAVVPAERIEVPVEVSQTFQTSGRRVEEEAADGSVTFENYNPVSSNTVPAGSIVSTEGGIRFRTSQAITLPAATFVLPSVIPSRVSVTVSAVAAGPAGNVPANAIRVVPQGENPEFLKVNNPQPTSGGAREEFPRISAEEVATAQATLQAAIETEFDQLVAGGAGAPAGMTLFPDTATLGEATPTVDPATLVGREVASFDLGLAANGTVIAVDETPIASIAEARLLDEVGADHRLVEGSMAITPGPGTVTGGQITFPVQARAARIPILDRAELLAAVRGLSVADARAALEPYGEVEIDTWPDWVTTITTLDSRVTVTIVGQDEGTEPEPGDGEPSPSPTPRRSSTPAPASPSPSASGAPSGSVAP